MICSLLAMIRLLLAMIRLLLAMICSLLAMFHSLLVRVVLAGHSNVVEITKDSLTFKKTLPLKTILMGFSP